jgi:hypothetical protein
MAYLTKYTFGKLCKKIEVNRKITLELFVNEIYNNPRIYNVFNKFEELFRRQVDLTIQHKKKIFLNDEVDFDEDVSNRVFIHIRRGDYLYWPSIDSPAALPLCWYQKNMNLFRKKLQNPLFVVFTDDFLYVKEHFSSVRDVVVSELNDVDDLKLMAKCQHGILSASSYAWWAAYIAKNGNPSGMFIAPLYWAGHKKLRWFPPYMKSHWLQYVEV